MNRSAREEFRRAGTAPAVPPVMWVDRWFGRIALSVATVVLLTLAFAPINLFFLAWIGLVPWLMLVSRCQSKRAVFFWSWGTGIGFFIANMWWLAYVTLPGMLALMVILGIQWSWAGLIVRAGGFLNSGKGSVVRLLLLAMTWVASEWFRGSFPWDGLPWLYIGHTQTPALLLCQIADAVGVAGVGFWVVLINGAIAMLLVNRLNVPKTLPALGVAVGVLLAVSGYGMFRMSEQTLSPGPKVLVVQANYPQSNSGGKGASQSEILDFHIRSTLKALSENTGVDLVVWSETMMPPINREARQRAHNFSEGEGWIEANRQITDLANEHHVSMIVGGAYLDQFDDRGSPTDMRNSAYFFEPSGLVSDLRYDKIHLVPFGEFMPFREGFPMLYRFFMSFSPYKYDYSLTHGSRDRLTVFQTGAFRFVTPICFEDIDAWLVARMFEGISGKRSDVIVNLTNDGWFKANENPQHLQAAIFRSIENRAPTARSVNTGISGFIDSVGRVSGLVAQQTEGVSVERVSIDSRYTLFTRLGDWFAVTCAGLTSVLAAGQIVRWVMNRKRLPKEG